MMTPSQEVMFRDQGNGFVINYDGSQWGNAGSYHEDDGSQLVPFMV